jgi:hypothetical protein
MGALTSNSIEGGNRTLKYELRADYVEDQSTEGECLLIDLKDSRKTFKKVHHTGASLTPTDPKPLFTSSAYFTP